MPDFFNTKKNKNSTIGFTAEHNLPQLVKELQIANAELKEARRAALNIMEDAILAKEALHTSEERLRITLEAAVDFAIINTNNEGIVQGWNSGAEKMFGYTPEEVMGKPSDIIFTEEDKEAGIPNKEMETARIKGKAMDERWHQRKDGSRFFMSGVMRPIYDNNLLGYVKIARDMTEQKLLEQQKDEFISIASHELKTPVTSIKAYTEFLSDTFKDAHDEESLELINKLNTQIDRLTKLINSLLDTTKIAEGQFIIQTEKFNLKTLIENCIKELQHTTHLHKIILNSEEKIFITADKERIIQVITNLISNAIKYSPKAGEILVNIVRAKDGIQVSVKDFGMGIPEDVKDRIFDRFYRVRNALINTYPGMGLGLYISATIIKRLGGKIWVESKQGNGSTFYFVLPYDNE